jgi:hypothetical protein
MASNIIQQLQAFPGRDLILHLVNGEIVEGSYVEANADIIRIELDDMRIAYIRPDDLVYFTLRKVS